MDYKNSILIGVPGCPWPTLLHKNTRDKNGEITTTHELGVIEDFSNPLQLPSARSYAETMGALYRSLPVRSQLDAFEFILRRMDPRQNNRIAYLLGDPGVGKSRLATNICKARSPHGPIITDAGGKNLEYLLFQTVFDTEESQSLTDAIDKRLADGSLDRLSLNLLKKFGKHLSEENGRFCVDWRGLSEDQTLGASQEGSAADTQKPEAVIREVLESVRLIERLDTKSMGIGFKIKEGPLVTAHREGRDIVIDEINKCIDGTEGPLQIVWQVLNGETAEHTVSLGGRGTFTFKRGQPGLVLCTGNYPKDGTATHAMSESFERRVPAYPLPDFTEDDWQDIAASVFTSISFPMLHRMMPGSWKSVDPKSPSGEKEWDVQDPESFTKKLFELSTLGMDDEERRRIREWQMSELGNWRNVLTLTKKLGKFFYDWSQLVDPESPELKNPDLSDILQEIDDPDQPTPKITSSTMIRHIEDALIIGPRKRAVDASSGFSMAWDWNNPVMKARTDNEAVEANFGTRLANIIMDEVYRSSGQIGKIALYKQLLALADQAGLIGDPPPIATLLNIDPVAIQGSVTQAKRAQNILAEMLRRAYPSMGLSDSDEDLLPLRAVQSSLKQISDDKRPSECSATTKALFVPNGDLNTVTSELFKRVSAIGKLQHARLDDAFTQHPAQSLVAFTDLLYGLAVPGVGNASMEAFWNKALTNGAFVPNEAIAVAQNQSDSTNLAVTSLLCRKGDGSAADYTRLHVFRDKKAQRTVVVGQESISNELYNRLKKNGIIYMDQNHVTTTGRLADEFTTYKPATQQIIKEAFLARNRLLPGSASASPSLAQIFGNNAVSTLTEPTFISATEPDKLAQQSSPATPTATMKTVADAFGL